MSLENVSKIPLSLKNLWVLIFWFGKMTAKYPSYTKIFLFWDLELRKCEENSPLLHKFLCYDVQSCEIVRKIPLFHANLCILWFWFWIISLFYKNLCIRRFWTGKMSGKVLSQTPMFVFWDFEWRKCQEHCPFSTQIFVFWRGSISPFGTTKNLEAPWENERRISLFFSKS